MTDLPAYEVVVSRDGLSGCGMIECEGWERPASNRFGAYAVFFTVQPLPKEPPSRVMVVLDERVVRRIWEQTSLGALASRETAFEQLGLYAFGQALDTAGMPPFTPLGTPATSIDANQALQAHVDRRRPPAPDTDVFAYAAAKIFWGWKFGLAQVRFALADSLRLGVPPGDIERVALAGDGVYWTRSSGASPAFSPTGRLVQDLPAGRVQGLARSPVFQVQAELGTRRYAAAAEHFSKAVALLTGPRQDLARSATEATLAVESLARLVTGRSTGILGDWINELRARGDLSSPLDRVFAALWNEAREEPGVRQRTSAPPSLVKREAILVVNIAASAILFLLELDRGVLPDV